MRQWVLGCENISSISKKIIGSHMLSEIRNDGLLRLLHSNVKVWPFACAQFYYFIITTIYNTRSRVYGEFTAPKSRIYLSNSDTSDMLVYNWMAECLYSYTLISALNS